MSDREERQDERRRIWHTERRQLLAARRMVDAVWCAATGLAMPTDESLDDVGLVIGPEKRAREED